jgi:hypothetical protein
MNDALDIMILSQYKYTVLDGSTSEKQELGKEQKKADIS